LILGVFQYRLVKRLPADASIEDAMEKLLFLAKIEKGIHQADAGKTIPHNRVSMQSISST